MKLKTSLFLVIIIPIFIINNSLAQVKGFDKVGTTSFQFLKVIPNARSAAMGGTAAATIQTSDAVFFNPAALTATSNLDFSISYLNWFLDVKLTSFSVAYEMSNIGTFGLQALVTDYGEIDETRADYLFLDESTGTFNPGVTGRTIKPNSLVFGLTFARDVTDKFTFGITVKYAREDLVEKAASNIIYDGGIIYRTGLKSLKLGTMLRHFGPEVKYVDKSYPLPQIFTIGISGDLIAESAGFILNHDYHRMFVAYDLSQTRDHSQQHQLGVEYLFKNLIALRSGYKFNYDEESWTTGFGLRVSQLRFDYSYNDFGEYLNAVHRFTLRYGIK